MFISCEDTPETAEHLQLSLTLLVAYLLCHLEELSPD